MANMFQTRPHTYTLTHPTFSTLSALGSPPHGRSGYDASGGLNTQADYIMRRREELKRVQNCYVLPKEAIARQHKLVICKAMLQTKEKQKTYSIPKTRWWKLNSKVHREEFVQKLERKMGAEEISWERLSTAVKEVAKEVMTVTSGKKGKKEGTWWWCEEVQEAIKVKRERKRDRDLNRCEATIEAYKKANKDAKKAVAKAKRAAYEDLYNSLEGPDGQQKAIRLAKQRNKKSQDVYQAKMVKDRNGQDCGNYRGIKLTSHTLKLWERIIDKRLRTRVTVSEQQFSFMPGRSTSDATFALRQLMETYRDGQEDLHCIFIDLEKAYDRVPRQEIWNSLRLKGVGEKHIRLIQDMYKGCQTQVRCAAGETEVFEFAVGLHQGSALSPFLFVIIIDCLTQEVQREAPWDMLFADDVVVCGNRRDKIEERLELWQGAMEDRVQEDGGSDKEVTKRIQAGWGAWKITGVMCDKNVPEKVKGRLYKTLVRPAMMYGMETVAVTKVQEERMQVAEMKMLRWSLGLTIMDKVRNETIRERVQVGELKKKLSETRLRWLGHVTRREESYVGRRVRRLTVEKPQSGAAPHYARAGKTMSQLPFSKNVRVAPEMNDIPTHIISFLEWSINSPFSCLPKHFTDTSLATKCLSTLPSNDTATNGVLSLSSFSCNS
ncbi:uncharacterized protein LOC134779196 [Penaeus indicus]|uniref:uncharacterized protein LOC134779196 n=1 Tax=Penaeus indicus TaxID=29960 RepID=UPI00300C40CD